MVIYLKAVRLQLDRNGDLCALAAFQTTTALGAISGAITIRCQKLLSNYQPLSSVRSMEQLPGGSTDQSLAAVPGRVAHTASPRLSWLESTDPASAAGKQANPFSLETGCFSTKNC